MTVRGLFGSCASYGGLGRRPDGIVPPRGESFFICQTHVSQHVVDGLNGAGQIQSDADLFEGKIGPLGQKRTHLAAVGVDNDGFATAAVVAWSNVTGSAPLLEELFDHAQRHIKAASHLFPSYIPTVIGLENTLSQIHGNHCHAPMITNQFRLAIIFFKML